jgi:hypothetical protein
MLLVHGSHDPFADDDRQRPRETHHRSVELACLLKYRHDDRYLEFGTETPDLEPNAA